MHKITILGLEGNLDKFDNINPNKILLRTKLCQATQILESKGLDFSTLDFIYDNANDFDELDKLLADEVIANAENSDILYIVSGSGIALDGSVNEITTNYDNVEIIYGKAPEYHILSSCKDVNASNGYSIIPASCLNEGGFSSKLPLIISAIDNVYLLSDIKLLLSNEYGDEHIVIIGDKSGYKKAPIHEIDRLKNCNHTTMIYVPKKTKNARYNIQELEDIFKKLRSPEGCPWDREQTHQSLKRYLLEECAEVLDAIDSKDMSRLNDELGDVLLQVLFHATIASERGYFDMRDVCDNLARKLIKRHPHVFSNASANNPEQVKAIWEEIKHNDRDDKSITAKLKDVPKSMTALMRAQKVLSRASKANFLKTIENETKLKDVKIVLNGINSLVNKLKKESLKNNKKESENLTGKILFLISNVARLLNIEAEISLNNEIKEYIKNITIIEKYTNIEQ